SKKRKPILFVSYFDEWIETYKVGLVTDITLEKYYRISSTLHDYVPRLFLDEMDRREYQRIINEYAKTRERQTVVDFHHMVKACLRDAFHDGLIDRDPTYRAVIKGAEPTQKKSKRFLETEELRQLLQSLELNKGINVDWFILIAAKTGLRFAEVLGLTPNDFDFIDNTLTVDKTWNYKSTKGGFIETKTEYSVRRIEIDWQIVGQFQPLLKDLAEDDPIFVEKQDNGKYKRVFNSTYNNYLQRKCEELKIPIISMHSLRHTHASVLLAAGVSIHSISRRLGHADIGITQETYAHILDELRQKDNQIIINTLMQI